MHLLSLVAAIISSGIMTYANESTVDVVLENRYNFNQLDPASDSNVGYIALMDRSLLGTEVWIEVSDGRIIGPLLVYDVSNRAHIEKQKERGWAACINHDLWDSLDLPDMPVPVTVYDSLPINPFVH